jgi:hypothetical protein
VVLQCMGSIDQHPRGKEALFKTPCTGIDRLRRVIVLFPDGGEEYSADAAIRAQEWEMDIGCRSRAMLAKIRLAFCDDRDMSPRISPACAQSCVPSLHQSLEGCRGSLPIDSGCQMHERWSWRL